MTPTKKTLTNKEIYDLISEKIVAMLDNGIIPWQKPWDAESEMPRNAISKRPYHGVNVWMLAFSGYSSPYWATFNQIKSKGGHVNAGEKGTQIYFYKMFSKMIVDEKGKPVLDEKGNKQFQKFPMLKVSYVFNLDQCEGFTLPKREKTVKNANEKLEICESIWANYANRPTLTHGGDRAFYRSSEDMIRMPEMETFKNSESYYATFFHEMGHSTGHTTRLNRELGNKFGSDKYGREELVAEFSSSYLCAVAGIEKEIFENSVAYIQNWKDAIKADPAMVMVSASKAQKAADLILGTKEEEEEEN